MRKVLFKKLIPAIWVYCDGTESTKREYKDSAYPQRKDGTGMFQEDFITAGFFHDWGQDSDDGASYTVAIVEDFDGNTHLVTVDRLMFVEPIKMEQSQKRTYDKILEFMQYCDPNIVRFFYSVGKSDKPWRLLIDNDRGTKTELSFSTFPQLLSHQTTEKK